MTGLGSGLRRALIGLPFVWLGVFFLLPLLIVAAISFAESADAIPPFKLTWTFANYCTLAQGCLRVYASSLGLAGLATVLCLLVGYPVAFAIARAPGVWRQLLLFLVMLPFWTSFLIRVYAWIAILQPSGLVNRLLLASGLIETPLPLLTSPIVPDVFRHGFTTRLGGVSAPPFDSLNLGTKWGDARASVLENRRRVLHATGAAVMYSAVQVHGARVLQVRAGDDPGELQRHASGPRREHAYVRGQPGRHDEGQPRQRDAAGCRESWRRDAERRRVPRDQQPDNGRGPRCPTVGRRDGDR